MSEVIGSGLKGYIHRQVRKQALNKTAEARERADEILQRAKEEAQQEQARVRATAQAKIQQKRRQLLAITRLEVRRQAAEARHDIVDSIWDSVEAELRQIDDPQRRISIIRNLLHDAALQLGGGELVIRVNERDQELLDADLLEEMQSDEADAGLSTLHLDPEPAPIWGGAIVSRQGSNQVVDNSLNRRLAVARRSMANRVYQRLSAEE